MSKKTAMETKSTEYLLEVKGLKKHFDVTRSLFGRNKQFLKAVDGVDLMIKKGETLGIVGESGCGKSTTGNVITRLLDATAGEVLFEGEDLMKLNKKEIREKRKDIQMVFQDPFSSLNPRMRVFELIAEPLRTHNIVSGSALKEEVYKLLDVVGLDHSFARRFPHEFSGGQRQRIGIARALALQPKLIVCDEPVSALDVSIQSQVLNLLARLQKEFQLTYIFIAHGLPAVKHISDQVAVMYLGRVVELAPTEALFSRPKHPYTEGLIHAIPVPDLTLRAKTEGDLLEGDLPSPVNPPPGCHFHTRCPYAQEKCKIEEPKLLNTTDEGHRVACHFPLEAGHGVIVGTT
ncbi:LOW QUALITY PROTEIN: oligopeptide transport ATP-binding protein OppF [Geomicrobium sp. JCM 19037]|nr:LOW QUALITY PROTEIN: oligopeptide transport ATP-binding protein OppF [Geomicrobium sp. JCM 19037]